MIKKGRENHEFIHSGKTQTLGMQLQAENVIPNSLSKLYLLRNRAAAATRRQREDGASHADRVDAEVAKEAAVFIGDGGIEEVIGGVDEVGLGLGRKGDQLAPAVREIWKDDGGSEAENQERDGECGEEQIVGNC